MVNYSHFERHCEAEFEYLAQRNPQRLVEVIDELRDKPTLLTFAAEYLGRVDLSISQQLLLQLAKSSEAVVREGAVLGLRWHLENSLEIRQTVQAISESDPSPGVRAAAQDAINSAAEVK